LVENAVSGPEVGHRTQGTPGEVIRWAEALGKGRVAGVAPRRTHRPRGCTQQAVDPGPPVPGHLDGSFLKL
jgi:hypothetical protein